MNLTNTEKADLRNYLSNDNPTQWEKREVIRLRLKAENHRNGSIRIINDDPEKFEKAFHFAKQYFLEHKPLS